MFKWFTDHGGSQTVFWAKAQQLVGIAGSAAMYALYSLGDLDPETIAPFVPPKIVPALPMIFFALGKITQILRERPGSDDPVVYQQKGAEPGGIVGPRGS